MASLNKVLLMGNLTRDPDLKYTQGGMAICALGLAVNRRFQGRDGQEQEETCFVDIDVFGKQAESCKNYLQKGSPALIEGRLRLDQWEDRQSGERRSRLKVTAERVQFLGGPGRGGSFNDDQQQQQAEHQDAPPRAAAPAGAPERSQPSRPPVRPQQAPPRAPQNQPSEPEYDLPHDDIQDEIPF